jgi:hypothetical protein
VLVGHRASAIKSAMLATAIQLTPLSLKPHATLVDNRSAHLSIRAHVLLAGGLDLRSLSSRCFVADHVFDLSLLPCLLAWGFSARLVAA